MKRGYQLSYTSKSLARIRTLHCFDSHTSGQVYHFYPFIASTLSATVT
nr:MAG TPA: hypothetical protein [Caudoviricetes sp.]